MSRSAGAKPHTLIVVLGIVSVAAFLEAAIALVNQEYREAIHYLTFALLLLWGAVGKPSQGGWRSPWTYALWGAVFLTVVSLLL